MNFSHVVSVFISKRCSIGSALGDMNVNMIAMYFMGFAEVPPANADRWVPGQRLTLGLLRQCPLLLLYPLPPTLHRRCQKDSADQIMIPLQAGSQLRGC